MLGRDEYVQYPSGRVRAATLCFNFVGTGTSQAARWRWDERMRSPALLERVVHRRWQGFCVYSLIVMETAPQTERHSKEQGGYYDATVLHSESLC